MKHLTIDEIIDFVSTDGLDTESVKLLNKVNSHIRHCNKCLDKIRAFQLVYDELECPGKGDDFEESVYEAVLNEVFADCDGDAYTENLSDIEMKRQME